MAGQFVAYYRVSTATQGASGLGLEAQRATVRGYLTNGGWPPAQEFTEVESGKMASRPQLAAALEMCRLTGATLVVAKLDRLARDVRFLLDVIEGTGKGGVVFCDLPQLAGPTGRFMLQSMAAVAELEAGLISQRTKAALAEAKRRGVKLGGYRGGPKPDTAAAAAARQQRAAVFAARVLPMVSKMRANGMSLRQIAAALTAQNITTSRGGAWTAASVNAVLAHQSSQLG